MMVSMIIDLEYQKKENRLIEQLRYLDAQIKKNQQKKEIKKSINESTNHHKVKERVLKLK